MSAKPIPTTVAELGQLIRESADQPSRRLTTTYPGGAIYVTPENQWAIDRLAEIRGVPIVVQE